MPSEIEYMKNFMPKKWMLKYYMSKFLMRHRKHIHIFCIITLLMTILILNIILLYPIFLLYPR